MRRQPHQLAFVFNSTQKAQAHLWTVSVATFYSSALQHIDPQVYRAFARDAAIPRKSPADAADREAAALDSSAGMTAANALLGSSDNIVSPTAADQNDAAAALPQIKEPVETLSVHYAVQLISMLGHFSKVVRTEAAVLVYQLASLCDRTLVEKDLEAILMGLETDDKGYYSCVHSLFQLAGSSFSVMVIALVAGLECFYSSPDWRVRGICNAALARLVFENQQTFLEEDHHILFDLACPAIWNLLFSLTSIPLISNVFPDRIVILKSLQLLAPIYAGEDTALSCSVVETLLRLKAKTPSEIESIKVTVDIIFDKLCAKRTTTGQPSSLADGPRKSRDEHEIGYNLFQEMISPHDEFAYDLLPWALDLFTLNMYSVQTGNPKTPPVSWFTTLNEFIVSLSNHFRAAPPLVRYGACLALHSTLKLCPTFVKENKQMWQFIIAGVFDTDYLSSFLYLAMLEIIETPDTPELRKLIARVRRIDTESINYDLLYTNRPHTDAREVTRSDILDIAVKHSPALSPLLLHKLANALDYLPTRAKLRQLELIRVWGKKAEKLDTFLVQMLVPLCGNEDERVQLETLRVIHAMLPGFTSASQADISFVWSYLVALMSVHIQPEMIKAVLRIIQSFPLVQLNTVAREELMTCLFKLIFNKHSDVRQLVYTVIGGAADFWKISGQMNVALSVLFLSIGDNNPKCAQIVLDQIQHLGSTTLTQIISPLTQVADSLRGPINPRIKAYDQLATALALHKTEYRPLIDAMLLYERIDEFWNFYLSDVPENQLARPDDYNYSRNFVQSPFWISILLTKFSCTPPPLTLDPNSRRDTMPTTPAGKRRFICGFMACLLPTTGMPDLLFRRSACVALVRCCIKGMNVNPGMLRGLLEYVSQQMLSHKHWTFQVSALEILGLIVRLKVPGIAESILQQYLDLCLDFLHNTPLSIIKIAVMGFIEVLLMVFPKAMGIKLQEIRDISRQMLVDKDLEVAAKAARIYPLVFRAVSRGAGRTFVQYLQSEISTILEGGAAAAGDPLVSGLTQDEATRVVSLSILSIGLVNEGVNSGYATAQNLLKFAMHPNPDFRASALTAILSLLHQMDQQENSSIIWMILPLYADPNKFVRLLFTRFLRNLPSVTESRCQGLPAHPEDMPVLPLTSWEEILTDTATIGISNKNLQDMLLDIDALMPHPLSMDLPPEDDGYHLPTVSEKLMARYKVLVQATTTALPPAHQSEVVYFLQDIQKQRQLQANAILVLSEFCCQHEAMLSDMCDMFVNYLSQELTPDNTRLIEACVLGLSNIAASGAHTFKQVLAKITTPPVPNEGDLLVMLYLSESIKASAVNKVPEILGKIVPVISSQRHALKKRMFAVYLAVDLSLVAGPDQTKAVLDAINTFVDSLEDKDVKQQIHQATSRILAETGPKHPFFRNMMNQAKRDVKSKLFWRRMQALSIFRLFAAHMTMEDCMWFVFHYLADSNPEIRRVAREVIAQSKMIEFAYPTLMRNAPKTGRRAELLGSCRLPAMETLGMTLSAASAQQQPTGEDGVKHLDDPFNAKYYASERRAKFTRIYGIPEATFSKLSAPATTGVLASIEARASNTVTVPPEVMAKLQWLLKLEPITILHDLIGLYPSVASDLIESLLSNIENGTKTRGQMGSGDLLDAAPTNQTGPSHGVLDEDTDVEAATHKIDVLSNLLVAHDGIGSKMPAWIKRFQGVIKFCSDTARSIRESLFLDIERSLYFYNEFVDIPIVSDEQFDSVERHRASAQEATLEIVKSGRTEKLSGMESRRSEMNEAVDTKSEHLRRITIIALHLLSGCGLFYSLTTAFRVDQIVDGFQFIADMLGDEHRGLRIAAVEALVTIVQIQVENGAAAELTDRVGVVVQDMLAKLTNEFSTLYRRKADYATLISQLVAFIPNPELRLRILRVLVQMWRDPDSEVRITAIKMVKRMGEAGLPEVLACFEDKNNGSRDKLAGAAAAGAAPSTAAGSVSVPIMAELASLVSNEDYGEKDILQDLLKWRFSMPASKPGTSQSNRGGRAEARTKSAGLRQPGSTAMGSQGALLGGHSATPAGSGAAPGL
ncbi:hypothetical protein HK105_206831 [Polyrhizophydium stewartii]|uniref:Non-specific serine/threonine protein kinase n=1 Tax=Polyrhizophydium stewartii TaxID=2732419 RepID=A0ABR4N2B4_9FUNG